MNTPIRRVSVVVVLLVVALLANATYVQVFKADELRSDPRNERVLLDEYSRQRGSILAGGQVMAQSVPTDDRYKYLRTYPKDLAPAYAPVTGYYSMVYSAGALEHAEGSILNGSDDRLFGRRIVDTLSGRDPRGGNVVTTINPVMQRIAYERLISACGAKGPCHGSVVAMEPQTGKILAMVSTPSYDPNPLSSHDPSVVSAAWQNLTKDPDQPMLNRATSQLYPPGSTFKVITTAAALSQGRGIDLNTRLTADKQITLPGGGGTTLQNYAGMTCPDSSGGTVSLLQAFQYSCNTAFVDLSTQKMQDGGEAIKQMANNFGVNSSPEPIPLPVSQSVTGPLSYPAQVGQSAIGQLDVALTPLQNAVIAATLANGGIRMQPYLVDSLQSPDLSTIATTSPKRQGQALSPEVAAQMRELMVASERNTKGSGGSVSIASKTGTAEHSEGQKGGEAPHAWYIGYGPVNDPKVAVSVIIENGGNQGEQATGGSLAAPIGRAVIGAAVNGQGN
ncbi:Penicillin-binding protein transpeptidase OS=Tsukamurella paurometabola (strain ATCC 8368 / DSM/ CCUG 35730 / CIP 100753 / JCM 10117 / KCTC 9821 / NBRC 16120 / NCIMB 702349 / NCTC 13040) OX=521096 GN=Tpau_0029 PE=3 SV=1 [Tsukamurella paurometabola]|uniref:Penicillin-binding protein transpeptidase n=1 Tax=Tsukamurella paurometabola (strain ATCC 8368 / DSM 20162 / CCUG 35730 / CIP 100753 / JCM 10117 / KCTC 9821 / NBRC 16120 / NCIMB 702349 / NCTC 13040) TaxID=521096 RepID=D5UPD1_TSUPD|nr:penicillin-binding protein 2 [Tsukamurella paurometabola]ADG76683.1 penicillin-binding protein transpeptidase [Tsukamurella paurometabola DSM 20162]SUP41205.1 Penicillin-binding protein A [Tsukamurella paurometabola]